jgi:hypothetical protein
VHQVGAGCYMNEENVNDVIFVLPEDWGLD